MTDEQSPTPNPYNNDPPFYDGDEFYDSAPEIVDEGEDIQKDRRESTYRSTASDPLFGLLIAGALSIGLTPLTNTDADMRYTLVWGLLALFGVVSWLVGDGPRIGEETPENLAWGIAFGLILGMPLLAFGGKTLTETSDLLFLDMRPGTLLAFAVFVMPLAETLFFRGILQKNYLFWITALIATGWNLILFFPLMNRGPYPLIIGVLLLMANNMYGYVRDRNGLAAAWLCQIVVNILLFFVPVAG